MIVRTSRYLHRLPLSDNRVLILHAISQLRVAVTPELARLIEFFDTPCELQGALPGLVARFGHDETALAGTISDLFQRGILTAAVDPAAEQAETAAALDTIHGRDPGELLDRYRRERQDGSHPYWSVTAARDVAEPAAGGPSVDVLMFGDCDVQMETDFLRREAARRGFSLRVAATFTDDVRLAAEKPHDAILIGALRTRAGILEDADPVNGPYHAWLNEAANLLQNLRAVTSRPILIDALPEPTVLPLGFADNGPSGHRNRFRQANLALAMLAANLPDVHVVDVAAALAAAGSAALLDDGLVSFIHFGSPGWMLQRPASEKAAVHGIFPDPAPLADALGGDPYRREAVMAGAHVDALAVVLGIGRKKCVIVDLDGVLWPGVLAETGSPFAWHPDISSPFSYVGLYFGIHEALKALKRRGFLLACVSKNDEATVRALWTYPDHYPHHRLLTLDDFVTARINWQDKSDNIRSIADELGFALDTFLFIDDTPHERARVEMKLPEVTVLGENLFTLRRDLLTDPRLQQPRVTAEGGTRTQLVKAQIAREKLRADTADEAGFLASLDLHCDVRVLRPGDAPATDLERLSELFQRTTQFNTTGRKFTPAELATLVDAPDARIYVLTLRDRFGDQGLVAGAVVTGADIAGFVMSCRVIGLGVEHRLLKHILADLAGSRDRLSGVIRPTDRNFPVRNLYRDNGFTPDDTGCWTLALKPAVVA